ncbi:MAG TPA: extracellular solute-binding protein, partial [Chloroflexi bacterium]|nr:extracellular solute-binding protein [Chloroflexota bacterium]
MANGEWRIANDGGSVKLSIFVIRNLGLILLLMMLLAGCGGDAPAPTSPFPTPSGDPQLLPTLTPTPTPDLQPMLVTLKLWVPEDLSPYGRGPGAAAMADLLDRFSEAYPDVQVDVTVKKAQGRGGLLDFLRTARDAAPSIMPDLVIVDVNDMGAAAGSALIQPLDDLISPTEMDERFPFAVEMGTVTRDAGGPMTAGFILGVDLTHLVYRAELFETPPISWTSIISPPKSYVFPAGGQDRQVNDATLIQYLAAGGVLIDAEGHPTIDEEVMISVLDFYSQCIGTGAISPTLALTTRDSVQSWEHFKAGYGTMAAVSAHHYWVEIENLLADPEQMEETWAVASLPTREGQPFSVIKQGWAISLVAQDEARQRLAILLLDWLISPDQNGRWTQASGYLPATKSALRMWDVPNVDRAALRNILNAAAPPPSQETMATSGRVMQEAVIAVLRRRATPEEAAAAAVEG